MSRKRIIAPVLLGVCLAIGLYTLNLARTKSTAQALPLENRIPFSQEITSCVKGVRVVKAEIVNPETDTAVVAVLVENTSDRGIVAISMESIKCPETYTTTLRSSFANDPKVVIKPNETVTLTMARSSVLADVPLRLGSAIYEDGSEEGCESSLQTLHELKRDDKARKGPSREKHPSDPDPHLR